ncbi:UNVERIFIED_CONTAM: hypothetical protein Sindi_0100900, partial [Sesamum indicum]
MSFPPVKTLKITSSSSSYSHFQLLHFIFDCLLAQNLQRKPSKPSYLREGVKGRGPIFRVFVATMTERRWSARRMAANARIAMVSLSHLAEKDYVSALIMTMTGKKIVMTGWILFPKLDLIRRLLMTKNARSFSVIAGPRMQEAFQPGATPAQPGKRHFLCYNMLASITTMEHDGYSHIE